MFQLKAVRKWGSTGYGMLEIPLLVTCFTQSLIIDTKIETLRLKEMLQTYSEFSGWVLFESHIYTMCFRRYTASRKGEGHTPFLKEIWQYMQDRKYTQKIINKSRQHIKKTSLWPTSSDSGTKMEPYFQKYLSNVISHSSILITKKLPSNEDEVTRL